MKKKENNNDYVALLITFLAHEKKKKSRQPKKQNKNCAQGANDFSLTLCIYSMMIEMRVIKMIKTRIQIHFPHYGIYLTARANVCYWHR